MNSPRSAPIRPKPRSPKSPRRKRTRRPRQNGRFASQNLPPPRPPHKPPAKSDRILPPLRFPRPPLIGMRRLRLRPRLPQPHSPQPPRPEASIPNLFSERPIPAARRSASARNRADQRRHHGCRRAHRRLPRSRDTIPTPNPRSAGRSMALSPAIPSEPLRRQEHPRYGSRTAGPNPRRATRLHTLPGRSRRNRPDQHHARADDKRRGLAGRAPGQAHHFHRRTHAAAA
jgi:hypothetical protein